MSTTKALQQKVDCPRCSGSGEEPGAPWHPEHGMPLCQDCNGNRQVTREAVIVALARERFEDEGTVEIDDEPQVSCAADEGGDNGAYVQAWVWVDFEGTVLDKEPKC